MCMMNKFTGNPVLLPLSESVSVLQFNKGLESRLNNLPDELLLMILQYLSNEDLLKTRSCNLHIGAVSQEILRSRTSSRMKSLNAQYVDIQLAYQEMLDEKKPRLDHFRGFLQQLPPTHIQEAAWYSVVPHELLTICECLVILKQGPLKATDPIEKWAEIKKIMSRYDFKSWYINLRENVEDLDMENVTKVQSIIMHDPSITYERVHTVSICGYNILIAIAASLQFATICQDLRTLKDHLNLLQKSVQMSMRFLNAL